MYVIYYELRGRWFTDCWEQGELWTFYSPTECQWIVPGTHDCVGCLMEEPCGPSS